MLVNKIKLTKVKVYSTETRCKSPVAKEALEGLVRVCEELLNIDNDIPVGENISLSSDMDGENTKK